MASSRSKRSLPYRIQLSVSAKAVLTELSDGSGIKQKEIAARLCEWLAAQPIDVQTGVLGLYPTSIQPEVAALILERRSDRSSHAAKGQTGG